MLEYAFEGNTIIRVEFKTDKRNIRSKTAISKIGGTFEGVLRNELILADGTYRNTAVYSIIDKEWEHRNM